MTARDLHCYVCFDYEEGGGEEFAFTPIFGRTTESTSTDLAEKIGSVLNVVMPCDGDIVPSLCSRCINLVNDIDFHELKLREDMYDIKMLYQNGVDARRIGVKIKRENDNFWGDIRDQDGRSFSAVSGLDGATLEELTLASAESVAREHRENNDVEVIGEESADIKPASSDDKYDSGNFHEAGSTAGDPSSEMLELAATIAADHAAQAQPGGSSEPSPSGTIQEQKKDKKQLKKRLVLGNQGDDGDVDGLLHDWSDDDMLGTGVDDDEDEDDDDDEAQDRAMMVEDPFAKRRPPDGDGGGPSGAGSNNRPPLGGPTRTSNPPASSSHSSNGGNAVSGVTGTSLASLMPSQNDILRERTVGIARSQLPQHVVGFGRVKTLIVREDMREVAMQGTLRAATSNRYAFACNVCNKKLKKRDAMEEHLRMHRQSVPKPTSQTEETPVPATNAVPVIPDVLMQQSSFLSESSFAYEIFSDTPGFSSMSQSTLFFQRETFGPLHPTGPSLSSARAGLCDLCGMNTPNLYQHKKTNHPDLSVFRCTCCQLSFTDEKRYLDHISKENRMGGAARKYICPEEGCGDIFTRLGPWRTHIRETHADSRSACSKCGKVFYSSYAMVHERKCIGKMEDYQSAEEYYRRRQNRKRRQLPTNPDLAGLDKHETDLQFCPKCCRKVKNRYWLIIHMEKVHAPRPFQCIDCGKGYSRSDQLEIHMMSHTETAAFRCHVCGKDLANPSSLKKHISLHEGRQTKPHECDICGKRFSGRDNLNVHIRGVHSTQEDLRYICDVCGKKFPILGWLKNHLRSHTNARPHTCPYCKKSFKEMNKLRVHERLHTGEKPYVCSLCPDGFIRAEGLKKHMLKTHNVDSSKMSYLLFEESVPSSPMDTSPVAQPGSAQSMSIGPDEVLSI